MTDTNHVDEQEPVLANSILGVDEKGSKGTSFVGEGAMLSILSMFSFALSFHDLIVVGFWEIKAPRNNEDWWTSPKPKETSPSVRGGWYECAEEYGG